MKIKKIIEKTVHFGSAIANSYINFNNMTTSVVAIITDVVYNGKPVIGYGFNSVGRYAATSIIRDRMIPKIMNASTKDIYEKDEGNIDPYKIHSLLKKNEKPGGHGDRAHAVGAIDMAVWDAVAKIEQKPLYKLLSERYNQGNYEKKVYTYGAGGYYYEGDNINKLKDELKSYLDSGFTDVKMKIGGTELNKDLQRIEAALEVLDSDGSRLMVDANGRLDLKKALDYGLAIKDFELKWYEEPLDPLDFASHGILAEYYPGAIATGENLFSFEDARNLLRHGGLRPNIDSIQLDPPLSYGLVEYMKILKFMEYQGWSKRCCIPHGGNQFCLHITAGLGLGGNECYPGVFQPFGGFADNISVTEGYVTPTEIPGIGFEAKQNLWEILCNIN